MSFFNYCFTTCVLAKLDKENRFIDVILNLGYLVLCRSICKNKGHTIIISILVYF